MIWFGPSKNTIRQSLAVTEERLRNTQETLAKLQDYIAKAESLVDRERERADDERARADRLTDSYLQANGLPATTATVIAEQKESQAIIDENFKKVQRELEEIYGETMDEVASV